MSASFVCSKWGAPRCSVRPVNRQQFPARRSRAGGGGAWGGQRPACPPADRGREPTSAHLRRWCSSPVPRGGKLSRTRRPAPRVSPKSSRCVCAERGKTSLYIPRPLWGQKRNRKQKFFQKIFRMVSRPRSMEICTARQLTPSARAISSMDKPSR